VLSFIGSLDSAILDYWVEYDALYPLNSSDQQQMQWASTYAMLHQVYGAVMASGGVKTEPIDINDLLPKHLQVERQEAVLDSQALLAQTKAAFRV
jgi:hypothetical protein